MSELKTWLMDDLEPTKEEQQRSLADLLSEASAPVTAPDFQTTLGNTLAAALPLAAAALFGGGRAVEGASEGVLSAFKQNQAQAGEEQKQRKESAKLKAEVVKDELKSTRDTIRDVKMEIAKADIAPEVERAKAEALQPFKLQIAEIAANSRVAAASKTAQAQLMGAMTTQGTNLGKEINDGLEKAGVLNKRSTMIAQATRALKSGTNIDDAQIRTLLPQIFGEGNRLTENDVQRALPGTAVGEATGLLNYINGTTETTLTDNQKVALSKMLSEQADLLGKQVRSVAAGVKKRAPTIAPLIANSGKLDTLVDSYTDSLFENLSAATAPTRREQLMKRKMELEAQLGQEAE